MTDTIAIIIRRETGLRLLNTLGKRPAVLSEEDANEVLAAVFQFFGPADGDGRSGETPTDDQP